MNSSKPGAAVAAVMMAAALSFAAPQSAEAKNKPIFQTSPLFENETDMPGSGAGLLHRTKGAIWANLSMAELDSNTAYTVWWIVFNNPNRCMVVSPGLNAFCGLEDLFDPKVNASVFYAGGFITGDDGTANVSIHLLDGRIPDEIDVVVGEDGINPNGETPGLRKRKGLKAEVHVQVRSHGAVADVETQISTFDPGLPEDADQVFFVFSGPGLE